jgi:hypothetical protein
VWRKQRALGWLLVPAPLLYLAFMGVQGRYFGRWLLPIFPLLCLLAALFTLQLADVLARRLPRPRPKPGDTRPRRWPIRGSERGERLPERSPLRAAIVGLLVAGLLAQGLVYSIHSDLVDSRADTRGLTRAWMLAHIPAGTPIVVEPVAPDQWGTRWNKYPSLLSRISPTGELQAGVTGQVGIEDYERTLAPALIGYYEAHGYCWVISGSTESGRAYADPGAVPLAIAYYRALARSGEVVYRASPYARGQGGGRETVPFGFDWSFDYYPLAYDRPGPELTVYRLRGGRCA